MIAIVTGATGFVGSHLVDRLLTDGYEVRCIVRKNSNLQWLRGKSVQLYEVGLDTVSHLAEVLHGAQYIFHVAGTVKSFDAEGYHRGNVLTTQVLLDAALQYAPQVARIVVVSSLSASGTSPDNALITESQVCRPLTAYGRSKVAQEQLCHRYMNRLPITIIRPPAIYGERDVDVWLFFKSCYQGIIATTWHDQQFSLVYVGDVVNGLMKSAHAPKAVGETYFISSATGYQWTTIADIVAAHCGKKARLLRIPNGGIRLVSAISEYIGRWRGKVPTLNIDKANEMIQVSWVCSSEKAQRDFDYVPQMPLSQGIKQTLLWYENEKWL